MLNGNYGLILLYLSLFFLISTDMYLRTNVPFQYTISGDREQVFLLYYKDFFEQICSDVQFISPPEEVGEFLLHLLNYIKGNSLTITCQSGKVVEFCPVSFFEYMEISKAITLNEVLMYNPLLINRIR